MSVSISTDHVIDAFSFTGTAPSYTITNTANLAFTGAGLQVSSPNAQTLITTGAGNLTFAGNGSAGAARLTVDGSGAFAVFNDTTTAGSAIITVQNSGTVQFLANSTSGTARITAVDSDVTFFGSSSALNATIEATAAGGQGVSFANASTAGSSTLKVNDGAFLTFFDSGAAGSATITNNNAVVEFQQTGSANNSTITTSNGGTTRFFDTSSGGTARFITNAGSTVDISSLTSAGTTAGSIEGAGKYVLGSKTLTVGSNTLSTEVTGRISGAGGSLVKVGGGTLILSGTNTYSGTTTISAGTLQIGNGGTTGALANGDIIDDAILAFNRSNASAVSNNIGGTGEVRKLGAGTLTLSGINTFSGGLTITAGTVSVAADNNLGAAAGAINFNGGTLRLGASFDLAGTRTITLNAGGGTIDTNGFNTTVSQAIGSTGGGGLTKAGAGTLTLSGSNTYSGGTTIKAGTIAVAADSGLGATSGSLALDGGTLQVTSGFTTTRSASVSLSGGSLAVDGGQTLTWNGDIGGAGGLFKKGTGTLVLGGNNSFGSLLINQGTVSVGSDANLGQAGDTVAMANGTTLEATGSFTTTRGISASGLVTVQVDGANTVTWNGAIVGLAALAKTGAGTLVLGASNIFFGATVTGGTLEVSADANLGLGDLTLDNGTLRTTASFTSSRAVTLGASGGSFDVDVATTLGWTGDIGGTGGLTKTGFGTLALGGTNGFTGGLVIDRGTVSAAEDRNLGAAGGTVTLAPFAELQLTGSFATTRGLVIAGSGAGGIVVVDGGSTVNWNGTVSGGNVALVKAGDGTLVLGGSNTYAGGTVVLSGTLQVSADANLGDTAGGIDIEAGTLRTTASFATGRTLTTFGGTLQVDGGTTLSWNGAIGGILGLTKTGAGTLILANGGNNYTGGTTVSAGTLQGTTASLQGDIVNNATVAFVQSANGTYAGVISGNGNVIVAGDPTTTLAWTGNNTYTGTTTINSGALAIGQLGSTGSLGIGNVINNGRLAFLRADDITVANQISGTGDLSVVGGTVTLTGANTYTGQTIIGSTIAVSADNNLGNGGGLFINNGTLKFLSSFNLAAGRAISLRAGATIDTNGFDTTISQGIVNDFSPGALIKAGAGKLTLNGHSTYTGGTTVNAGELALNGSVAGNLLVNGGGTLSGIGTIGGNLTVQGTVTPGNSIGTLTVGGNYTQAAGSSYIVEVNAAGQSDLIRAGSATLQGGVVTVQPQTDGTYKRTTTYVIVSTTGATTGSYAGVTSSQARLVPTLVYAGNGVTLSLLNLDATFNNPNFTPNENAVANVLNQLNAGATGDLANVLNALSNLDSASLARVLDLINGQVYAGFGTLGVQTLQTFMDNFQLQAGGGQGSGSTAAVQGRTYTLLAEACDVACDTASPAHWGAWGGGVGALGTIAGDTNSRGLTYNLGGFAAGLDRRFGNGFKAGVATGFSAASLYPQGTPGTGTSNTLQFALYGEYAEGPIYLDALAGYAHADNRMSRPISIPGLPYRVAQGYTTANQFFGQVEAGYRLDVEPRFGGFVMPFARLQGSTSTQNGFSESGADSMNLSVATQTTNSLRTVLGAQLGAAIDAGWHGKLNVLFRAGWSHEFADLTRPVSASFAGAPALTFTTQGAIAPRDGVVLGLGLNTALNEQTSLYLRYDGDLAGGNTNHALSAGIRFVW